MKLIALTAALVALDLAPSLAAPPPASALATATPPVVAPPAPSAPAAAPASFYRLEFAITGLEGKATPDTSTYTMMLAEGIDGDIRSGVNVPFASGANSIMREDLGADIKFHYATRGNVIVLEGRLEVKGIDDAAARGPGGPSWRHLSAYIATPITPGVPTQLTNLIDSSGKRHYEVTVTAKRIL